MTPRLKATAPHANGKAVELHERLLQQVAACSLLPEEERTANLERLARRFPGHFETPAHVVALVVEVPVREGESPNDAWDRLAPQLLVLIDGTPAKAAAQLDVLYMSSPAECERGDVESPDFDVEIHARGERLQGVPA